ncbi:hypothetical protein QQF64_035122 [Cirrhinus molitorella]|uniref:C2 domain-containing protein n=1 Tax=Cirrhinus molitorella TaxID=172907 RepID=A0ABR3NF37_9TELE
MLMLASQLDFTSASVRVFGLHARDLTGDPIGNDPDPYVKVWCGGTFGGMTEFRRDSANPSWSAEFNFPNCKAKDDLKFEPWQCLIIFGWCLWLCWCWRLRWTLRVLFECLAFMPGTSKTEYHKDNANPSWAGEFNFPNCLPNDYLNLEVWDKDLNFDDHLGTCSIKVQYGTNSISCGVRGGKLYFKYELVQ